MNEAYALICHSDIMLTLFLALSQLSYKSDAMVQETLHAVFVLYDS